MSLSSGPAPHPRGFTLLEMLVALSVLSIAALTLLRLDAFALRSAADLDTRAAAQIVAHNKAVEIWSDPAPPTIGTADVSVSNGGRDWRVSRNVQRTDDPALIQVDILVRGTDGGAGQAALTIIRRVGDDAGAGR